MNFDFTDEQRAIGESLRRFLKANYAFAERQAAVRGELGWRREVWSALAQDLGLLGVALPSARGGLGGGPIETMIVMEALGEALVVEPYLETIIIGAEFLARSASPLAAATLRKVIAGECVLGFAWAEPTMRYDVSRTAATATRVAGGWRLDGRKAMVTAAPWADAYIVTARTEAPCPPGLSLFLIDRQAEGIEAFDYATMDGRCASDLILTDMRPPQEALLFAAGMAGPLIEEIMDRAIAALCAEAVGITRRLLADTLSYTGARRQFGQPLAGFQALQHRMVEMHAQVETAASAAYLASLRLNAEPAVRARAASAAKVTIGAACRFVGENAVQLHGGMGMTDDLPIGHYFKRGLMIEAEFGDTDHHLARHARLAAAPGAEPSGVVS